MSKNETNSSTDTIKPTNAASLTRAVSALAQVGMCHRPSFSPSSDQIAFISDLNGSPQVWTVPVDGGWPTLVTNLPDPVNTVAWSPTDEWLALEVALGGSDRSEIYIVRPNGTDLHKLTNNDDNVLTFLDRWLPNGDQISASTNLRKPDGVDVCFVDIESGAMRLVVENEGDGFFTDISQDGRHAILHRMVDRTNVNLFLVDLEAGAEALLTPHTGPGRFDKGLFSPDGHTIYVPTDQNREMRAFGKITLDQASCPRPIEVLAERHDGELQDFQVTADGSSAALVWNVGGCSELTFLDLTTGTLTAGPNLPVGLLRDLAIAPNGDLLAMTLLRAAGPRDIFIYSRSAGKLWPVTQSAHAGVDLNQLIAPELIHFQAHDGLMLSGWLYCPSARSPGYASPGPIVINFHGGPEAQACPVFRSDFQALLGQGIAIFDPNIRGSSGFGKTFLNLDNGELRFNAIRDIKSCIDAVVEVGAADPQRIGIMGDSFGGYLVMAGLTEFPDMFAAGATLYGIVNFETFLANADPMMAVVSKVKLGDLDTELDLLRRLSPIHKIDRVTAPLIVFHGENDTRVPISEAEQVVSGLQKQNVPVKFIRFANEGHEFRQVENRTCTTVELVRWFEEHLCKPIQ